MQKSNNSPAALQRFALVLFDGFSNHCLANLVEPLRAANTFAGRTIYAWDVITVEGAPATSSSGLQITPKAALTGAEGDTLVVMPSYGFRTFATAPVARALRRAAQRFDTVAGLDTGSWLLARAGLLDGYTATIHWEELTGFAEAFPEVAVQRDRFIMDRDRLTCSGAMAAFDLAMHLITRDHGPMLAMEVGELFLSRDPDQRGAPRLMGKSRSVSRAVQTMQTHLEDPWPIAQIARAAGCSQKTLETRMRAELAATPQAVYRRLRLILARKLVTETDQPLTEIASRCGYDTASAMTRAFKAEFGKPPREIRAGLL